MLVRKSGIGIVLIVILAGSPAFGGGPRIEGAQTSPHFFHRLGPVGGWNPDGGGLFHWWNRDCFASPCTPDDYCRKPLPRLHCPPCPVGVDLGHRHTSNHGRPIYDRAP